MSKECLWDLLYRFKALAKQFSIHEAPLSGLYTLFLSKRENFFYSY